MSCLTARHHTVDTRFTLPHDRVAKHVCGTRGCGRFECREHRRIGIGRARRLTHQCHMNWHRLVAESLQRAVFAPFELAGAESGRVGREHGAPVEYGYNLTAQCTTSRPAYPARSDAADRIGNVPATGPRGGPGQYVSSKAIVAPWA